MRVPQKHVVRITMAIILTLSAAGLAQTTQPDAAQPRWKPTELLFVPDSQVESSAFGMVMVCPSHAHGTPDEAYAKLTRLLATRRDSSPSTIWVCRANLLETLKRFGPAVDRVCVNPFVVLEPSDRSRKASTWMNAEHPCLGHLQEVLDAAGATPLLACIDLGGEDSIFGPRMPDFEELRWQICAVLGSGFKGIVWRGQDTNLPMLPSLIRKLDRVKSGMANAIPISSVRVEGECPISVMRDENRVYVVVLHPAYLLPRADNGRRSIELPLGVASKNGSVVIPPAANFTPSLVGSVFGTRGRLLSSSGTIKLEFSLSLGGDIFEIQLR